MAGTASLIDAKSLACVRLCLWEGRTLGGIMVYTLSLCLGVESSICSALILLDGFAVIVVYLIGLVCLLWCSLMISPVGLD